MPELHAAAPAKINLVLDVLGRRDDGYHELRTVLQTVSLADHVRLEPGSGPGVSVTGPAAAGTPADATNLAWRAMSALATRCDRDASDIAIHIEKHIPAAAGLGGGASDAATVLRLLQRLWPGTSEQALLDAATAVGSDEAFFLFGGTARAEGRGERVAPLADLPPHDVVLFVPRATLEGKTARLFQELARRPYDDGVASAAFLVAHPRTLHADELHNAFERVAFDAFPGLGTLRAEVEACTGAAVRLAGAGPTLFWIGPPDEGEAIARLARSADCSVYTTQTVGPTWAR